MTSHDFGVFLFETIELGGCIRVDNAKLGALVMTLLNIQAWDVTGFISLSFPTFRRTQYLHLQSKSISLIHPLNQVDCIGHVNNLHSFKVKSETFSYLESQLKQVTFYKDKLYHLMEHILLWSNVSYSKEDLDSISKCCIFCSCLT